MDESKDHFVKISRVVLEKAPAATKKPKLSPLHINNDSELARNWTPVGIYPNQGSCPENHEVSARSHRFEVSHPDGRNQYPSGLYHRWTKVKAKNTAVTSRKQLAPFPIGRVRVKGPVYYTVLVTECASVPSTEKKLCNPSLLRF